MATRILPGKEVSVQFFNHNGTPDGDPIRTLWVALHGTARNNVTGGTAGLTQEERDVQGGSDDWLTLIAVADTKEKLQTLVDKNRDVTHAAAAHSSAASLRVRVAFHIGDRADTLGNAITIADGVKHDAPAAQDRALDVESIMILPSHDALNAKPELKAKFNEMIPFGQSLNPDL